MCLIRCASCEHTKLYRLRHKIGVYFVIENRTLRMYCCCAFSWSLHRWMPLSKIETMKLSIFILSTLFVFLGTPFVAFASASSIAHEHGQHAADAAAQERELNTDLKAIWNYVPRTKITDFVSFTVAWEMGRGYTFLASCNGQYWIFHNFAS